jgi:Domain of unknown function (DUF6487)
MSESTFQTCPRCGKMAEAGFAAVGAALSFAGPDKFRNFAFADEDVSKAGIRKFLPWAARYFRSYLCRSCKLYIVDYSVRLTRAQANHAAEMMTSAK